jgi:hypothetical protein
LSAEGRLRAKADATKQSILRRDRWIASLNGRAFARPLARNDEALHHVDKSTIRPQCGLVHVADRRRWAEEIDADGKGGAQRR